MALADWRSRNLLWEPPDQGVNSRIRALLQDLAAFTVHPSDGTMWRGHSSHHYRLTPPGARGARPTDPSCTQVELLGRTEAILADAFEASRYWRDGFRFRQLPPLQQLAHLQHQAGGTPLIDLTPDPMVALWMACQSSPITDAPTPNHGLVIGFNVDSRWWQLSEFQHPYPAVVPLLEGMGAVGWFIPLVSNDRIVVQRSRFLVSRIDSAGRWHESISDVWLPDLPPNWLTGTRAQKQERFRRVFRPSRGRPSLLPVVAFSIPGPLKEPILRVLSSHYGITGNTLFPDAFGLARGG